MFRRSSLSCGYSPHFDVHVTVALLIVLFSASTYGSVLHAPTGFPTIQSAIDAASDNDTVIVAPGTYTGSGNRDLGMRGKSLLLISASGAETTTIDAGGSAEEFRRCFNLTEGEDTTAIIDGFTLKGGFADYGGGIYCENASPTIRNCRIIQNRATEQGGGMFLHIASPKIEFCLFAADSAWRASAVSCWFQAHARFYNCTISRNVSSRVSGIMLGYESNVTVIRCLIFDNQTVYPVDETDALNCIGETNTFELGCTDIVGGISECVSSQAEIDGNFSLNPLFCDPDNLDFRLMENSPCAPESNDCGSLIGAFGVGCTPSHTVRFVNAQGSGDAPTIQAAIDQSNHGDTIKLAAGTYIGSGNRDIDFRGKAVALIGVEGFEATIINCEGTANEPHRGMIFDSGEDSLTMMRGLTITNAFAPADDSTFGLARGGGVICLLSTPHITSCAFTSNSAHHYGAGAYCTGEIRLDSCSFKFNDNQGNGTGGAWFSGSRIRLKNCKFVGQTNQGLEAAASKIIELSDCNFEDNIEFGARLECDSLVTLSNCIFEGNSGGFFIEARYASVSASKFSNHTGHGAMITGPFDGGAHATVTNCVARDNNSSGLTFDIGTYEVDGCQLLDNGQAGLWLSNTITSVSNCTFVGNSAAPSYGIIGSAINSTFTELQVSKSILAFNLLGPPMHCEQAAATSSCNDVYGNTSGDWVDCLLDQNGINGNFSANPEFCDTASRDYRLFNISPCAPPLNSCEELIGALPVACWSEFVCGDADGNHTVNISDAVRLINYIFAGASPPVPPEAGDPNCSGAINISDAVFLINYIFAGGPAPCAACP